MRHLSKLKDAGQVFAWAAVLLGAMLFLNWAVFYTALGLTVPADLTWTWLAFTCIAGCLYHLIARQLPPTVPDFRPTWLSWGTGVGALAALVASILGLLFVVGDGYLSLSSPPHLLQSRYLALLLFAALMEEFLFRGLLLRGCMCLMPTYAAVGVQAALFAAVHMINDGHHASALGGHFLSGILFARIALLTNSTAASWVLHAGMNILSGSLAYSTYFGGWGVVSGVKIDRAGFLTLEAISNIYIVCTLALLCALELIFWFVRKRRLPTMAPPTGFPRDAIPTR